MDEKIKTKWVKALRSGRYKQAEGQLKTEDGYCCLGVLCQVAPGIKWDEEEYAYVVVNKELRKKFLESDREYDGTGDWYLKNTDFDEETDEPIITNNTKVVLENGSLPTPLLKHFGLDKKVTYNKERVKLQSKLISWNDDEGKNFKQIADYVEKVL